VETIRSLSNSCQPAECNSAIQLNAAKPQPKIVLFLILFLGCFDHENEEEEENEDD
jgi:hypothetical protein